ncbi:hypothetical protein GCM10023331_39410 [Algivirga pacifica]|uniref:Major capsid protein N-terminal domain-containing protein n=2 Tax=Algivirga pacifica TaxID=1162670 RepID=A0ABP9DMX9_9BACT
MAYSIEDIGFKEEIKWLESSSVVNELQEDSKELINLKSARKKRFKISKLGLISPELLLSETDETEFDLSYLEPKVINEYCKVKYYKAGFLLQIDFQKLLFGSKHDQQANQLAFDSYKKEIEDLLNRSGEIESDKINLLKAEFEIYKNKNLINTLVLDDSIGLSNVNDRFFYIARTLLSEFSQYGVVNSTIWPKGLAQDIVEHVMGSIPTPSSELLTRYVCKINNEGSTVLLNPRMTLKIDNVEIREEENELHHFSLIGTTTIPLYRNEYGYYEPIPFLKIQYSNTRISNNTISSNDVLQSSTGDIQLTKGTWSAPYIFLHQKNFKQNVVSADASSPKLECMGLKNLSNPFCCTSNMFHYVSAKQEFWDGKMETLIGENYCSSFGARNLVVPLITVYVNDTERQIPLNTSFKQLINTKTNRSKVKIFRLWYGRYKRICLKNTKNLLLLPEDKITF